jgi:hypothetical protein
MIVAGLVVLAMVLGSRKKSHRAGMNWWIGLAVLLLVTSGFMGIFFIRGGSMSENRQSVRRYIDDTIGNIKDDLRSGVESAREAIQEGMKELSQATETPRKATTKSNRNSTVYVSSSNTTPKVPRTPYHFTVSLAKSERSTRQETVDSRLKDKVWAYLQRWVDDRMPYRTWVHLDMRMLEREGVFEKGVNHEPEEIRNPNTGEKETLFGGTMQVTLSPALQETLLDIGYEKMADELQMIQLAKQFVVFTVIVGITVLMAIFAIVRRLVMGQRQATAEGG